MARGDGRQIVFENDEDRKLFLALLRNRKQQDAPIFAWCLMDNHFHLVIQASLPVLSLMMQQIMLSTRPRSIRGTNTLDTSSTNDLKASLSTTIHTS